MTGLNLPVLNGTKFRARFETELRSAPTLRTLQINIGYVCNLACNHCHVESSPARTDPSTTNPGAPRRIRPASTRSSTVFPDPLGPTIRVTFP